MEKGKPPASLGTKNIAKPRNVQYAQMIAVGPHKLITIYRDSYTFLSSSLTTYKDLIALRTQNMLTGAIPYWNYFGQLPKRLGLVKSTSFPVLPAADSSSS